MSNTIDAWQPDESQQRVINLQQGVHLVLAPPGCGKTQILSERVRLARNNGVNCADMLCLTFTNRAARGMMERIKANIDDDSASEVFVGNVHRFCSRFLYDNGLIAAETSVIDDDDALSILARYTEEDEMKVAESFKRRRDYFEIIFLSHLMHQIAHAHPKNLRLHADCLSAEDVKAMRNLCELARTDFTPQSITDIYLHASTYESMVQGAQMDYASLCLVMALLRKMKLAKQYEDYKRENKLIDFEDLLLLSYDALTNDNEAVHRRYSWLQVDEVQDLNPLQLAIVDALTDTNNPTVMFLGDEQQAIFSFMGAKLDTLNTLRQRCGHNVHHLAINHRSPKYLLNVFNTYATAMLNIDPHLLPKANNADQGQGNELQVVSSNVLDTEYKDVAQLAGNLQKQNPNDTTAIIVNANRDADDLSCALHSLGLSHFKVSGQDLFATPEVKLLFAHLNILANPHNFIAWARLLKGLRVFEGNASARNFVQALLRCAMLPTDLLSPQTPTYVEGFAQCFDNEEIVVFDTETTGLNVFEDDIVQIAAVRMRAGRVVEGSAFNVFIQTQRPVPAMLGDIPNPIVAQLQCNPCLPPAQALQNFMQYVGNSMLLGHNADFDYNILRFNLQRYCPEVNLLEAHPTYFDSLKLIRLLQPGLKQYKLKALLEVLHLEGTNSHLADEDVMATVSLVNYCRQQAAQIIPAQQQFLARQRVQNCAATLRQRYSKLFNKHHAQLYSLHTHPQMPAMMQVIHEFYNFLVADSYILPVPNIAYVNAYLQGNMLQGCEAQALIQQLQAHIMELNTLKEADLCGSDFIDERIYVTTIHKAKGLEFDNVLIFDAVDGRYPYYYTRTDARQTNEDARKFYVAMTRAKQRLFVTWALSREGYNGTSRPCELTPFMRPVLHLFNGG